MIVPEPGWWLYEVNPLSGGYHSGHVGSEVEREPDDRPRKPIGFPFEKPEPVPADPSWLLL